MNYDVIIATYNGEKYVIEQLESIVNQTIKPSNIYIRDDGSLDNTIKILEEFKSLCNVNIEIISGQGNLGYIKNFEKLVGYTVSDIVFFSDQDDIWKENKAQLMLCNFSNNKVNVNFSDAYLVNDKKEVLGGLWDYVNHTSKLDEFNLEKIIINNIVTGATLAIRRNFLMELLPFPESIPHDHWIAANAVIKNCLSSCAEKLILYRQHNNNQIGAINTTFSVKLKRFFSRQKFNKRLAHYVQIHLLIENLVKREALEINDPIYKNIKEFISYMNAVYNGRINDNTSAKYATRSVFGVFFKDNYFEFKTKKSLCTDCLDAIFVRTIFKNR
ncbi:glycosyltransferase [Enterobacteriaceae bacterium Kacie_13]|nr:glycosyltransferase [Enterobacteriaceae bacterium Kacie_13]